MIPRGVRFRVELPDGAGARLRLRELRRAVPPARPRRHRRQRPRQSARLPDAGARRTRTAKARFELVAKFMGNLWSAAIDHSPLDVVAWHGNYAPYKYDLRALQHHRLDQLRPSRSVDLPGAAVAERHAGRRHDRLRDLPAAHPGDGAHVPPAVVPPQRRERVHGPDPRRLRRQGRGLRARRREPAQLHDRARAGRRDVREGERRRPVAADAHPRHDGVHVRDARGDPPDARSRSSRRSCSPSTTAAGRDSQKHFDPAKHDVREPQLP